MPTSVARALSARHAAPLRRGATAVLAAGAVLCVLAFLPHRPLTAEHFAHAKELVLHVTAVLAVVLCVRGTRRRVCAGAEDVFLVASGALGAVSLLGVAANPWLGWRAWGLTASALAVFWCARAAAASGRGRALVSAVVGALGLLAASALLEAYGGVGLSTPGRAPGGTLGHRNTTAHLLVLGFPLLVLQLGEARRRRWMVMLCLLAAASAAVVVLSRSRGAWLAAMLVAALAAGAVLLLRERFRPLSPRRAAALGVAVLVGGTCAVMLPNQLGWRSGSPHLDTLRQLADHTAGSGRGRVIQYAATARMVADHPLLGVGPGNWMIAYPRYARSGDPSYHPRALVPMQRLPQGDWLGLAAERGIPALAALLLAAGAMAVRCLRQLRAGADGGDRHRAFAALCALAAAGVMGSFDPVLLQPVSALIVALVVGTLVPPGRAWRAATIRPGVRRPATVAAVLLLAVPLAMSARGLLATALLSHSGDLHTLERAARVNPGDLRLRAVLANEWLRRGRCDRARPHADAAVRLFPTSPAAQDLRARCRARRQ